MKYLVQVLTAILIISSIGICQVINVPDDFETIQEAIDEAGNGTEIVVAEGVYEENIVFSEINIRLTGDPDDPSNVVIDGGEEGSVVRIAQGNRDNTVLDGLTLRNGNSDDNGGGGIYIRDSSPTLRNLIITNNYGLRGGGILL